MAELVKVGSTSEVPAGGTKGFTISGKKILIANIAGKYYAIGSVCTHAGGPLEEGNLDGNIVTCPWHGSQFDVETGKATGGPARKEEPAYEVIVKGGDLLVRLG